MDLIPITPRDKSDFTGLDGQYLETVRWPGFGDLLDLDPAVPVSQQGRTVGVKVSGPVYAGPERPTNGLSPDHLDELSAYQHRYFAVDFRPGQDSGDPDQPASHQVADLPDAHTWSSELVDAEGNLTGYHTVMLDIDFPVRVIPSSSPGHYHLYIDRVVEHDKYFALLEALVGAEILEPGYVEASRARGATHLRLPWVKKGQEFFSEDEDEVAQRSGVNHAIPESLAIGLEQSKAGQTASLGDFAQYREFLDEVVDPQIKAVAESIHAPDVTLEEAEQIIEDMVEGNAAKHPIGGGAASVPRRDIVEELKIRNDAIRQMAELYDANVAASITWDVEKYEVQYVDGKGVLRPRRKAASQDPEA